MPNGAATGTENLKAGVKEYMVGCEGEVIKPLLDAVVLATKIPTGDITKLGEQRAAALGYNVCDKMKFVPPSSDAKKKAKEAALSKNSAASHLPTAARAPQTPSLRTRRTRPRSSRTRCTGR